ncbi:ribosomal RNA small subunit methyltransferase, mitochondrial [Cornus florida]|uniref:ribosomal RNA small subunit methyltransferase, mitochondrial n=1 Tax=Cornus florida TaxID=4283 RepID=UPI00289B6AD2|nr:ribosomal RNA small subunit methyltransferase, mitochondrial [Cornus florida]XP_059623554.1 ribosomal RNA small subunit methyltransferase, mitochondrial [Cornus florida]
MIHRPKFLSTFVSKLTLLRQPSLQQQLRAKYSRRYNPRDEDEDDDRVRKRTENQEKNIHLHKSMGQHILTNQRVLDSIVQKSDIRPTDTVLEIGPGTGNLTLKLLEVARKVIAVEIDKRMVEILHNRVAEHGLEEKLTVICKDALKTEFPQFDLVVANIPYGISSPLLAKLVFGAIPFRSATLLLQKEFARRLLANPGDSEYNRLAANVKLVAEVEFVMDVSKRHFLPCPKVDSSVVKIRQKAEIPEVDLDEWRAFTAVCFIKKNKTLGATFKQKRKLMQLLKLSEVTGSNEGNAVDFDNSDCSDDGDEEDKEGESDEGNYSLSFGSEMGMNLFKEKIIGVLKSSGFEDKRPSKLSNEELLHLLSLFNQAGIHFRDRAKKRDASNVEFAAA